MFRASSTSLFGPCSLVAGLSSLAKTQKVRFKQFPPPQESPSIRATCPAAPETYPRSLLSVPCFTHPRQSRLSPSAKSAGCACIGGLRPPGGSAAPSAQLSSYQTTVLRKNGSRSFSFFISPAAARMPPHWPPQHSGNPPRAASGFERCSHSQLSCGLSVRCPRSPTQ